MTTRFLTFIPFILEHEGGDYENVEGDSGGPTKWGIDTASHQFLGAVNLRNLSKDEAIQIYYDSTYRGKQTCKDAERADWQRHKCQGMPPKLGESFMDAAVNTGSGRARQFLAASDGDPVKYNNEREAFYHRLATARPSLQKFLRGWTNRVNDLRQFLNIT